MKFDKMWENFEDMVPSEFFTLDKKRPFTLISITDDYVVLCVHENYKNHFILKSCFEDTYKRLCVTGMISLTEIDNEIAQREAVYIAAMLSKLPSVKHNVKPILLQLVD